MLLFICIIDKLYYVCNHLGDMFIGQNEGLWNHTDRLVCFELTHASESSDFTSVIRMLFNDPAKYPWILEPLDIQKHTQ